MRRAKEEQKGEEREEDPVGSPKDGEGDGVSWIRSHKG